MESDGESAGKTYRKRRRAYSDYEAGTPNENEQIRLALALSLAYQEELELRRRGAKPCYVCKRFTLSGIKVTDPDCPHVACTLEHMLKLHDAWCDLKYGEDGFLKMDKAWVAQGKLGEASPQHASAHRYSSNSDAGAPSCS